MTDQSTVGRIIHRRRRSTATCLWLSVLLCLVTTSLPSLASTGKKVAINELDEAMISNSGLLLNNFNLVVEEAFFGGTKVTAECTGKNKTQTQINYTVYIAAFDSQNQVVACFALEPMMNVHSAGKLEILKKTGMLKEGDGSRISFVLIRVVIQPQR